MVYGYVRVSTHYQTVSSQMFQLRRFARSKGFSKISWIEETASGAKDPGSRKLGALLESLKQGDILICSELSRLGRSLFMIISILNDLMRRKVEVYTVKDNFHLGDDLTSKVIAFAFGLSAEIERNLISQRVKEALALRKSKGLRLGRPPKLLGREEEVMALIGKLPYEEIGALLGVSRSSVYRCVKIQCPDKGARKLFFLRQGGGSGACVWSRRKGHGGRR